MGDVSCTPRALRRMFSANQAATITPHNGDVISIVHVQFVNGS